MLLMETITSDLKDSPYIITSIAARPIRFEGLGIHYH